mmetsp:Transcript_21363/g.45657  ORF Transcript_21363/g.45657 Transcript_21363/m.45657 type:complete len:638 (+) Transcript_21363:45-1958(+)|eukprot:CAMPEP_0172528772 /NCGR_PEP_ID=MMETSP1067-20121228/3047_1 /TAXON_ID=265564 ORGANISM="Thalassiosira punctigera, Strain Tpunct2005C2" /NCGR_SAMPLE_ID=MMETSP1067 /ASSEMBLY_ACC=CAM_ASM_000444 /LENGTH=637 /DNA_ID=CAMNT_0013312737 /DNA_START=23 /DNA_END=1936 /DNA_ORIENTATION=+
MASSMVPTFVASLRAVGTACTMAFAGFYLHRRGFVTVSGKKMMALLSQQVTIPAYLFAKIIYCPSGGGGGRSSSIQSVQPSMPEIDDGMPEIVCPSVANRISDLWMLLLWPFFVVFCGLCTGYFAAKISRTPPMQTRSCLAACAFANSTGLPITLLSVIHKQFRETTALGRIDPTAFLSVYLLLYPILQWGMGGWLLAPEIKADDDDMHIIDKITDKEAGINGNAESNQSNAHQNTHNDHANHPLRISHLLNHEPLQSPTIVAGQEEFGGVRSRRLVLTKKGNSENGGLYTTGFVDSTNSAFAMLVRELSFTSIDNHRSSEELIQLQNPSAPKQNGSANGDSRTYLFPQPDSELDGDDGPLTMDAAGEATTAVESFIADITPPTIDERVPLTNGRASPPTYGVNNFPRVPSRQQIQTMQEADILPLTGTLLRIASKVFQPPVIGALLGLFIASFPNLRGLLENIWGAEIRTAPFKWMFDGIYSVGQAAVPINMTILGINLSSTFQKKKLKKSDGKNDEHDDEKSKMLSNETVLAVIIGKMVVMPVIGIASTWFLQRYYIDFPDEIDSTCYLVMMIVFITPTANNVMVMVELSGSSSKEGMARLIGWQYIVSPVVLSLVLSVVVSLASTRFDESDVEL